MADASIEVNVGPVGAKVTGVSKKTANQVGKAAGIAMLLVAASILWDSIRKTVLSGKRHAAGDRPERKTQPPTPAAVLDSQPADVGAGTDSGDAAEVPPCGSAS